MRTGIARLPLHSGKAPMWLFTLMVQLAREVLGHVVSEFGPEEVLRRLSDPFWFQAFGCVLGFDWHSSGVTIILPRGKELETSIARYHDKSRTIKIWGRTRDGRTTDDEFTPIFSDGVLDAMLREIEGRIRVTCEMTVSLFARL